MEGTYIVRFGNRIKIGFSGCIRERLRLIPHEELLAEVPSGEGFEAFLHEHFQHLRVRCRNGMREWFLDSPTIRAAAFHISRVGADQFRREAETSSLPYSWGNLDETIPSWPEDVDLEGADVVEPEV